MQELSKHRGIGSAKASVIASAMELGRRLASEGVTHKKAPRIMQSQDAYDILKPLLEGKTTEEFWVLLLTQKRTLIRKQQISKGGIARTTVDPRVIFKSALEYHAATLVLAHNHPSGSAAPSSADIAITDTLLAGAKTLDLKILDHIIVGEGCYFSFADEAMM